MKHAMSIIIAVVLSVMLFGQTAKAQSGSGGNHAFEFALGVTTANQSDMNAWITSLNAAGTQQFGSAYELSATYMWRIPSSIYALIFRPSYFTQTANGGPVSASLTGFTFYPMLRFYPLESALIHFFMQIGFGYGQLSGSVTYSTTAGSASFSGNDFGMTAGLGTDFCFGTTSCVTVEGNFRYNPIARSLISTSSNAPINGTLAAPAGKELEFNNLDVQNTLSGIQGMIAYTLKF